MQLYTAKYIKFLKARDYSLEKKCAWSWYYDCSCQLSHFIWTVL